MASILKTVLATCLLVFILMEGSKPVLEGKNKCKKLKKRVQALEDSMAKLGECKACSAIEQLEERIEALENITVPKPRPTWPGPIAGLEESILKDHVNESALNALADFLEPVVQSNYQWKRCWRASTDGGAASTFHSLCDNKGPTVTIVRVGQYVFGGYASVSWDSNCELLSDSSAFLFSLVNNAGWGPVKLTQELGKFYEINGNDYALHSCSFDGPTFGGGYDLYIADYPSYNTKSFSNLGSHYAPPSGYNYFDSFTQSFLAGSYYFTPGEVEVFYQMYHY